MVPANCGGPPAAQMSQKFVKRGKTRIKKDQKWRGFNSYRVLQVKTTLASCATYIFATYKIEGC